MNKILEKVLTVILAYRWVAVILAFAVFLGGLKIYSDNIHNSDNSLPVWLEHSDLDYVNYQTYLKEFENDRIFAIAFEVDDAFSSENLQFIHTLSRTLADLPQVERVFDLTTAQSISATENEIVIEGLFEKIPQDPKEIEKRKQIALNDEIMLNNIVSADASVTALFLTLNVDASVITSNQLIKDVRAVIQNLNTKNYPVHLSGPPITDSEFERLSHMDQQRFLPILHLVIFLVTVFFFRNLFVAVIPIIVQVLVVMIVTGTYFLMGRSMNVVTAIMGTVLVAVSVADCVHLMLGYYEGRNHGLNKTNAIINSSKQALVPCFFTALTTFAGFIAFNASPIVPNKVLGMYTAYGVMLAYVLTILFIPVLLTFLPDKQSKIALIIEDNTVQQFLSRAFILITKHTKKVAFVFLLATIASFYGMTHIKVETNTIEYFPAHEAVRKDVEFFQERLTGIGSFELVLDGRDAKYEIAKDPGILKKIESFKILALQNPFTHKVVSYTEYLKRLNKAFHNNDPEQYRIPDTKEEIAQLLLIAESSGDREIQNYKTLDNSKIHISVRTAWRSSEEMNAYFRGFKRLAQDHFRSTGVDVILTGVGALWIKVDDNILVSEYYSFTSALIMVVLMMMMVLKNIKAGIISMIPNVMPIIFAMGLMGFFDIDLNVTTVMTAGVAIGITVDDSIHYLMRFKKILGQCGDYRRAIEETNRSIGTAVVFTSTVLVFGFGVLMVSQFSPSVYFGAVTALTLFLSVFCEIFMMPLLLLWLKPFPIEKTIKPS